MNIALDYDNTFTRDPQFWKDFIVLAKESGHDVHIVTYRRRAPNIEFPVICCQYQAKATYCEHLGLHIDIWIDDSPYFINHAHPQI